jgi:hypothetical protein
MSQVAQPHVIQPRVGHRRLIVASLLALVTAAAVILAIALSGGSTESTPAPVQSSGPSESNVAAAVAGQPSAAPTSGPDESKTAASISGR